MKFARVLQDSQTPEWRTTYMQVPSEELNYILTHLYSDYEGLKSQIVEIHVEQGRRHEEIIKSTDEEQDWPQTRSETPSLGFNSEDPNEVAHRRYNGPFSMKSGSFAISPGVAPASVFGRARFNQISGSLRGFLPSFKLAPRSLRANSVSVVGSASVRRATLLGVLPLHHLLTLLTPQETAFFAMLDEQLDKVDEFYIAREEEMIGRGRLLQKQLNELNDHRDLVLKAHSTLPWTSNLKSTIITSIPNNRTLSVAIEKYDTIHSTPDTALRFQPQSQVPLVAFNPTVATAGKRGDIDDIDEKPRDRVRNSEVPKKENKLKRRASNAGLLDADPDGYFYAKRKLKKAVLEHYRGLELLHNYRVINVTGFRKAIKKFEKVTKIPVQKQYMKEKESLFYLEKRVFASSGAVKNMMKEMEDMYAHAFLKGDKKKATARLRAGIDVPQTHHYGVFKAGIYLGLALPPLVDGLVKALQESTRTAFPGWGTLLLLYGVLFIPTLFSLLFGLNLMVWTSARINYVFIFELDARSRIDWRAYFEIPAILLSSLIYTFWLSFAQITSSPTRLPIPIRPALWPLVWIGFAVGFIINPLPVMHRSTRYWFLRKVGKLFISGTRPVQFPDYWMGNQLCSVMFSMAHIPTFVCVYADEFRNAEFAFASLPFVIRLVQSMRRYRDSRHWIQLINSAKYSIAIMSIFFYFYWRRTKARTTIFILWCFWTGVFTLYACIYDLCVDWSLLRIRNTEYQLLRSDLVYINYIPFYYVSIVTNILLRFTWVFYIPIKGPDMLVRAFTIAMLEMLRRWQWNFFRLENEHVGNIDQYRVTREMPLPYSFGRMNQDEDEDEDERQLKADVQWSVHNHNYKK